MNDWQTLTSAITACRACPRLVAWREEVAAVKRRAYREEAYWGRPVPGFGDPHARVLIIGLAPAAHGANRTGRMFTGDSSGDFLYAALHRAGFASQPTARRRDDGLTLDDAFISAACRCAPPDNKPLPAELAACRPFLEQEIALLSSLQVVVALGRIAFDAALRFFPVQPAMSGPASQEASPPRQVEDSATPQLIEDPGAPNKFGPRFGAPNLFGPYTGQGAAQGAKPIFAHAATYPLAGGRWLIASYHPSRQNTQTGRLTAEMFDQVWAQVVRINESANQQTANSSFVTHHSSFTIRRGLPCLKLNK